jgi:uncharacterized protein
METTEKACLLRIFISSTDTFRHAPLYEVIIFAARRHGLAGATALRGIMGYGGSSLVYSNKFWEVSEKIPLVLEIIDSKDRIHGFISFIRPWFDKVKSSCIMTVSEADVILSKVEH